MTTDRICPGCSAAVKPAMLKCFECGTRLPASPPARVPQAASLPVATGSERSDLIAAAPSETSQPRVRIIGGSSPTAGTTVATQSVQPRPASPPSGPVVVRGSSSVSRVERNQRVPADSDSSIRSGRPEIQNGSDSVSVSSPVSESTPPVEATVSAAPSG